MSSPVDANATAAATARPVTNIPLDGTARWAHPPISPDFSTFPPLVPADDRDPMLLSGSSRLAALLDAGILVVAAFSLEVSVGALVFLTAGAPMSEDGEVDVQALSRYIVPIVSVRTVVLSSLILVITRLRCQRVAALGLTLRRLGLNLLIGAGTGAAIYGVIVVLMVLLSFVWPEFFRQLEQNPERLKGLLPDIGLAGLLGFACVVGFWEELAFRGFLMPRLRRCFGHWIPAVLVSTVLFTLLHMGDQVDAALPLIFVFSLMLSAVTIWRRSLVPAIVGHALFDFVQFAALHLATQGTGSGGA